MTFSLANLFGGTNATPAAPAAAPAAPASAPATALGAPTTPATAEAATPAPLDQFTGLWETDPNSNTPPATLFGDLDPKKVFESAKSANFAGLVSPEQLNAISQGGEAAQQAFVAAMNAVSQGVFAQSTLATTKIVEQAIAKTLAQQNADLPGLIKRHTASDSLHAENPALSNPAAQPIIAAVQAQLAIKHPNASAAQLTAMAKDYLSNFAEVVKPTKAPEVKSDAGSTDWSTWGQ